MNENKLEEMIRAIDEKIEKLNERFTNFLELARLTEDEKILDRQEKINEQEKNIDFILSEISILREKISEMKKNIEKIGPDRKILERLD